MSSESKANDGQSVEGATCLDNIFTRHMPASFWEELGRAVATFGLLEEVLKKAILLLSGIEQPKQGNEQKEYNDWIRRLETTSTNTFSPLADNYISLIKKHNQASGVDINKMSDDFYTASKLRNAFCHGSWGTPDTKGASPLFYIDKKLGKLETLIDIQFIKSTRSHTTSMILEVIKSITDMGYQFPGTKGPGTQAFSTGNRRP